MHEGNGPTRSHGRLVWAVWRFFMTLKVRVQKGRLVLDEPIDLPEGTEVDLLPLDPGDWLNEDEGQALHRALDARARR
jgi:hypothetical protein